MLQERETTEIDFAFRPSLVKRRFEELRSFGANDHEAYSQTYDLCRRDLTYYFLEQFAKKKLVGFEYRFEEEADGSVKMVSAHYEQFGDVCGMFAKACDERRDAGLGFSREQAEFEGLEKIKNRLIESNEEASVLLISRPPDDVENRAGYGDYSFVYFGHFDPAEQSLKMHAWRNEMNIDEHNKLYNAFAGSDNIPKATPDDFLRSPAFKLGDEARGAHDKLLEMAGGEMADFYQYRREVDRAAKVLVDMAATGASDRLLNLTQADVELDFVEFIEGKGQVRPVFESRIESFSTEQEAYFYVSNKKQELNRRFDLSGYAKGGCGLSAFASVRDWNAGTQSLLTRLVVPDLAGSIEPGDYFTCPKCDGKIESGRGTTTCPHCGFTKEQAAEEMGIAC